MGDVSPAPRDASPVSAADDRLDSWKEIAAYLKRDVSTVQRWEKKEGLPVYRHQHDRLGSVYAFKPELDAWWSNGRLRIEGEGAVSGWRRTRRALEDWRSLARATLRAIALSLRAHWRRATALVLVVGLAFVGGVVVAWRIAESRWGTAVRVSFQIPPPEGGVFEPEAPLVSPDGRHIAFVATDRTGARRLWIRSLEAEGAMELRGTDEASNAFWSPDSRMLGFFSAGKLKTFDLSQGLVHSIGDAFNGRGGTWSRHGIIVFAPIPHGPLMQVPASGGRPRPATTLNAARGERSHNWPVFLADGRRFLFNSWGAEGRATYLASLDSPETTPILSETCSVAYDPERRRVLFFKERLLMAQPFDEHRGRPVGLPMPVAEQLGLDHDFGNCRAFLSTGRGVLATRGGRAEEVRLAWVDRLGREIAVVAPPGIYSDPALSPDERQVAFSRSDAKGSGIWILDLARGTSTRLTFNSEDTFALWSPDGRRIAYITGANGRLNLQVKDSSGSTTEESLLNLDTPPVLASSDWSSDKRFILYSRTDPRTNHDVWLLDEAARTARVLLRTASREVSGQFSPDGRWITYSSDETGRWEVYVQPFPLTGGKWQVSIDGGQQPRWRSDGKEIFYVAPNRGLMAAGVTPGPPLTVRAPSALFRLLWIGPHPFRPVYAVSGDGQRFLVPVPQSGIMPITVVVNPAALAASPDP